MGVNLESDFIDNDKKGEDQIFVIGCCDLKREGREIRFHYTFTYGIVVWCFSFMVGVQTESHEAERSFS